MTFKETAKIRIDELNLLASEGLPLTQICKKLKMDYRTAKKHLIVKIPEKPKLTLEERFWSKVDKNAGYGPWGDCWIWTGAINKEIEYGYFLWSNRVTKSAHRCSYAFTYGDPGKLFVLHKCDFKICVRPDHLKLGTNQDNIDEYRQRILGKKSPSREDRDKIILDRWLSEKPTDKKSIVLFCKTLAKELDCLPLTVRKTVKNL